MLNKFIINLIEKYQSSKSIHHVPRCRHYPSCSEYSKQCFQKFNFFYASFLTTKRILSCNRFCKKSYDPVPLTKKEKLKQKELTNQQIEIIDIIKKLTGKYPLSDITDILLMIIESIFSVDLETVFIDELNFEYIGNNVYRVYDNSQTFNQLMSHFSFKPELYSIFFIRVNIFKKMIKNKEVPFKKDSIKQIDKIVYGDISFLKHSKNYVDNYNTNYYLVKGK